MHWFEICIIVLCAVVVLMYLVYAVGFCVLTRRYKKFYETTEEGRELYCALYTKDRLGSRHDWLVNRMNELTKWSRRCQKSIMGFWSTTGQTQK